MRNKLSCYNRTLHIYVLRGTELIQSQINLFPRKTRMVVGLPKYIIFVHFSPARKSSVMIFTAGQDVTFVRSLMLLSISLFFFPCCYYFFLRCFFNSVYHAHQAFAFRLRTCWYCACNWSERQGGLWQDRKRHVLPRCGHKLIWPQGLFRKMAENWRETLIITGKKNLKELILILKKRKSSKSKLTLA